MRLLCVDDDRINVLLIEQMCLTVAGVEFARAETGAEAIALASTWDPHVLLLDLHLPDTDGLALLPRMRKAAGGADLLAVLCTAEHPADVIERARSAGFDDCWGKPLMLDDVQSALRRWRDARAGRRPGTA
jgi:CheY-like chemotaxis protein